MLLAKRKPMRLTRGCWRGSANGRSRRYVSLADEQTQSLRTLWVRREQLLEMLVMEENRLEHAPVKAKGVRHNLRSHYRTLLPWHLHFLPKRRESVTYVSGYVLLPMCRVGHLTESGTI
jgi:transposase